MWANNCALRMVASMMAEDTNQRAALRSPGVIWPKSDMLWGSILVLLSQWPYAPIAFTRLRLYRSSSAQRHTPVPSMRRGSTEETRYRIDVK